MSVQTVDEPWENPMPRTDDVHSRQERKRIATRETIVDAAERLLEEGGPDAVTLPAVSNLADVALQTIYNRVGGRNAVLLAVAERAYAANRVYVDSAYREPGTPSDRVRAAALAYARFAIERPHQFRLLLDPPDLPEALEGIADLADEQNGKLAAALRDGIADGTIRSDIDPALTSTLLWAMFNGVLALSWRADRHRLDPLEVFAQLDDIINDGLRPR